MTIVRDKRTGVPHITGTTRYGTEFGAGYAAAQDRLWLMDLFRHVGRGQLTPFAGGAPANQGLEQQFWRSAPYTEAELEAQIESAAAKAGERGKLALADVDAYLDGVNAYIDASDKGRYFPGEYVLTGHKDAITNAGTIAHFERTDLIALASVIGSLFGSGGGGEVANALSLLAAQEKYGVAEGTKVWESFRQRNDPEAVLTQQGGSFPYLTKPDDPRGRALPDPARSRRSPWCTTARAAPPPRTRPVPPPPPPTRPSPRPGAACPTPWSSAASTPRAATRSPSSARRPATSRPSSSCSRRSRAPASAPAVPPSRA